MSPPECLLERWLHSLSLLGELIYVLLPNGFQGPCAFCLPWPFYEKAVSLRHSLLEGEIIPSALRMLKSSVLKSVLQGVVLRCFVVHSPLLCRNSHLRRITSCAERGTWKLFSLCLISLGRDQTRNTGSFPSCPACLLISLLHISISSENPN